MEVSKNRGVKKKKKKKKGNQSVLTVSESRKMEKKVYFNRTAKRRGDIRG